MNYRQLQKNEVVAKVHANGVWRGYVAIVPKDEMELADFHEELWLTKSDVRMNWPGGKTPLDVRMELWKEQVEGMGYSTDVDVVYFYEHLTGRAKKMAIIGSNRRTLLAKEYSEETATEHIYDIRFPGVLVAERMVFTKEVPVEEAIEMAIKGKHLLTTELTMDVEVDYMQVFVKRKREYRLNVTYRKDEEDGETSSNDAG